MSNSSNMSPPRSSREREHAGASMRTAATTATNTQTTSDPPRKSHNNNNSGESQQQQQNQRAHSLDDVVQNDPNNNNNNTPGGLTQQEDDNVTTNDYYEFSHTKEKQHDDDEMDDFMARIIDGSCQGIGFPDQVTNCQSALPACQARIEEQLDLLTHCRQPLGFLSFFQEHPHARGAAAGGEVGVEVLPAGVYAVPLFCEYCGAEHVRQCDPQHCPRPALYFQKKRPPFCKPNPALWNPITDHAVLLPPQEPETTSASATKGEDDDDDNDANRPPRDTPTSWVSGFFRGNEK